MRACSFASVMSDSLQPHGLSPTRLLWPLPTPRVCSDSCPLSQWCHPTISSSVVPFSFCPQSFLALGSFPTSWLFALDGQENGSFTISSSNEYSGLISFRIDWFDLLAVQGTLTSFLQQHSSNHPAQTFIFHRHREWGWSPENPTISWWGSLISLCHEVQLFFDLSIFLKDYFIMKHFQGKWMKHV